MCRVASTASHKSGEAMPSAAYNHWWLEFFDATIQRKYNDHRESVISAKGLIGFLSLTLCNAIFFSINVFGHPMQPLYARFCLQVMIFGFASYLPGYLLAFAIFFPKSSFARRMNTTLLGNIFIIAHICSVNSYMSLRAFTGKCAVLDDPLQQLSCNPEHDSHALPQDLATVCILYLVILQVLVKCHDFYIVVIAWFISFSSITACIITTNAFNSFFLPVIVILMLPVLYEYENNAMQTFILMLEHEKSLQVLLEKQSIELHAEEMKHLLGNVAHDLKTPMQGFVLGLEGLSKILRSFLFETDKGRVYSFAQLDDVGKTLNTLHDTSKFMFMTINRALDYSKVASGIQLVANLETVRITEVVQWAIDCVKNIKTQVTLEFLPVAPNICSNVITDRMWLVENLLCLISNAVKFTTEGKVTVACTLRDDMLRFEVEDDGIGVSDSVRHSLFRPYRQAQRFVGGTGLGLFSLSKRVEALHGTCGLDSRSDGKSGSRFWFEISYRPDEPAEEKERLSVDESSVSLSDSENKVDEPVTVLLVEDALMVQKMTAKALKNIGWQVDVADNGDIGLRMMKEKKYRMVLMDLQMPVMDGLESVKRLRHYELDTGVRDRQLIIGVSANSDADTQAASIEVGMDAFLPKPFTVKQLLDLCTREGIEI